MFIAAWQVYFILNVPDIDTDAYVHHSIARQIILHPADLSIHWVWLPVFHYLSAGAILLGAGMETLRFANIIIWSSVSLALFFFIVKQDIESKLFIALLSSVLCALFPVGILMGTTAQPEPLFALLILSFVIFASKEKFLLSSLVLTIACLLRYEAWAVLFASFVLFAFDIFKSKKKILNPGLLNLILPSAGILVWALLRKPFDGELFGFLHQTQEFANDALKESNSFQGGIVKIFIDFFHYPVTIPAIFTGLNIIFLPFGLKSIYKQNRWLLFSGMGILGFITASWLFKSNLGLNRHFVSVIPFYSVLTAYGILNVSKFLKSYFQKKNILNKLDVKRALLIIIFVTCASYLVMWLYIWQADNKIGFPERKSAIEFFKTIDDGKATIFCNDAIFEINSGLDMKRFNHVWMENNPAAIEDIKICTEKEGSAYIITSEDKIKNLRSPGKIIYTSPKNPKTANTTIIIKTERN